MSTFKIKNTKYNSYCQNNNKNYQKSTLDIKHQLKLSSFDNIEDNIQKISDNIDILQLKLNELDVINPNLYNIDIINKKAQIKTQINDLEFEKKKYINNYEEIDYFYSVKDILDEYYNNHSNNEINNKENINEINNEINNDKIAFKNLNDIFNKTKLNDNNSEKSNLYNKYMKIVFNENVNDTNNNKYINYDEFEESCPKCKNKRIINQNECLLICKTCGITELIIIKTEKSNIKDPLYKRINHLSELLNQFQAKESTDIDDSIYDQIRDELARQRITNYKNLNHINMRIVLKKLKLNKYYEHIQRIINKLNGIPPPSMSREVEEKIKQYFKEIQKPFTIYKPKNRKNFCSYNYIIHKLLELLELDEFLPYFPLLKSRDKLEEQDAIWEKICKYLNYQFIPSI